MMPQLAEFSARAAVPEDHEFLYELYASTRAEELELAKFPEAERAGFCRMQFNLRQHHYGQYYGHSDDRILLWQNVAIGRELITRDPDLITLTDIAILPSHRGRGIGSFLLRGLIAESEQRQLPISLFVDYVSRAQALYERHGFIVVRDLFPHLEMRRAPA
jgi:ribosomal protein S18 acetylase RimI-like enzyme